MTSKQTQPSEVSAAAARSFNEANAAYRSGDFETALGCADKALTESSDFGMAHLMRARCLSALNELSDARSAYQRASQHGDVAFSAFLELGNIQKRLGSHEEASTAYAGAIQTRPKDFRGYLAAALLAIDRREIDDAARNYHLALSVAGEEKETLVTIHRTIAEARLGKGDASGALEAVRQAWIARHGSRPWSEPEPADVELRSIFAKSYLRLGLISQARQMLEYAARTSEAQELRYVAAICYQANFWEDAIAVLKRAIALHADDVDAHLALADMQSRCWKLEDAERSILDAEQIAKLAPVTKHQLLGKVTSSLGDVDAALGHHEALVALGVDHARSSVAMTSLYSAGLSPEEVADRHKKLFAQFGSPTGSKPALVSSTPDLSRLKVGMVTGDLHRQHPVNIFMQPILARWPKNEIPLTVYFIGESYDAQTRLARNRVRTWRECSYDDLPKQVAADGIDVLIDLAGHTSFRAMRCFAQRLAPIQVSYLGYPGSTGVPNMDWIIGDPVVSPEEHEHLFSEQIARLPNSVFCFAPEVDYPPPAPSEQTLNRPLTFGSFNNVPKLTEDTIRLWSRLMIEVNGSRLLLKAPSFQDSSVVERYLRLFADSGIGHDRLEFRGPSGLDEMMQEYADVDIALDPIHYGGGTTTLQAMWMGVPVLTLKGGKYASRMGASFMQAAGLPEFVAKTAEQFVERGAAMSADRSALLELKRTMRTRLKERDAWDADLFVQDFVNCLRSIAEQGK
ncbi:MAG: tetratricopeptide repeat protein [Pseudomonadota bacterium]